MPDFSTMYFCLFNAITDAVRILEDAQLKTEEIFVSEQPPSIISFSKEHEDNTDN